MVNHHNIPPSSPRWTLDELGSIAEQLLLTLGVVPESGRVRTSPDERTLRYYMTIGLLARPAGSRGRTALFDRRHLAQIIAIKRLQASGLSLAEVQAQLAGLTPSELESVAKLPGSLPTPIDPSTPSVTVRQERPPRVSSKSAPRQDWNTQDPSATGSWIQLGSGAVLMLPAPFRGGSEALLDVLQAAAPLLAELRRQGAIPPEP
jgi:DNA-binding transcriptional MerR regulator